VNRTRFVKLSGLAFGLVFAGFVVLGFSRIVLPYRTARVLAAPVFLCATLLVAYLFVRAVGAWTGLWPIEE
jgi:hypothetical protein